MSAVVLLVACQWIPHADSVVSGAEVVPVDVRPAIFTEYFDTFSVELFDGTAPGAAEVPTTVAVLGDWFIVNPDEPLLANHTYELQMTGTALAWDDMFQTVAFTTGTGSGAAAPPRPVINWVTAERARLEGSHTCGFTDLELVRIELATSPAPYYEVELRAGERSRTYLALDLEFTNYRDGYLPSLDGVDTVCARVTAIGLNGERSPASAERCQAIEHCSRPAHGWDGDTPCDGVGCSAAGTGAAPWLLLLAVAATAGSASRARRRGWAAGRRSR